MYPILWRFGAYTVYSYTVTLALGILSGVYLSYRIARHRLERPESLLDAAFWGLLGGIIGGRAGYVGINWAYFGDHLDQAWAIWQGGLSWHGALWGGLAWIAVWYLVRRRRGPPVLNWRDLADAAAPGLALGGAWGWLGCLLTGCGYGAEAGGYTPPVSWFVARLPDIFGVWEERFITQPLMLGVCVLACVLLCVLGRKMPRGGLFALYLCLYALADLGVMFWRGDGMAWWGLWPGQWVALCEMAAGVAIGVGVFKERHT